MSDVRQVESGVQIWDAENNEWIPFEDLFTIENQNEDNTMKYRVTTTFLKDYNKGDIVVSSNGGGTWHLENDGASKPIYREIIERNPDWFEPVEEVQEGQYWEWNGGVYRVNDIGSLVHLQNIAHETDTRAWDNGVVQNHARKLSTHEIEQALVKEAKRRGYKRNNFKCLINQTSNSSDVYKYYSEDDVLFYGTNCCYDEGNWAEIVDQTPHIEINGKTIEVEDGIVKISCGDTISEEMFKNFYTVVDKYDLNVSRNGEDINEQLQQIWDEMPSREVRDFVTDQIPIKIAGRTFYATELDEHFHGKDIRLTTG